MFVSCDVVAAVPNWFGLFACRAKLRRFEREVEKMPSHNAEEVDNRPGEQSPSGADEGIEPDIRCDEAVCAGLAVFSLRCGKVGL